MYASTWLLPDTLQHSILSLWLRAHRWESHPLVFNSFPVRTCILWFVGFGQRLYETEAISRAQSGPIRANALSASTLCAASRSFYEAKMKLRPLQAQRTLAIRRGLQRPLHQTSSIQIPLRRPCPLSASLSTPNIARRTPRHHRGRVVNDCNDQARVIEPLV